MLCALGTGAAGLHAQERRPTEEELFAQPETSSAVAPDAPNPRDAPEGAPPPTAAPPAAEAATPPSTRAAERSMDDTLLVGGQIYLRALASGRQGQNVGDSTFSAPSLLDVYLDARPSDRVRGFALGRLRHDPTTSAISEVRLGADVPASGLGLLSSNGSSVAALDQLWLRFDVARYVFVTAGKQHVRWGTGRFWMPTDYLHEQNRDPLEVFDTRTGTTMLKAHLPIESRAWNFYAYGIVESQGETREVSEIAGAARAELVLDATELGLGVYGKDGEPPKFAADLSSGIGSFDAYGELALLDSRNVDRVRREPAAVVPPAPPPPSWQTPEEAGLARLQQVVDLVYPVYQQRGYRPQIVGGISYAQRYNDGDTFTVGAEYFYNGLGYGSSDPYLGLVLPHSTALREPARPFYLGRHYAALFVSLPAPFSLDLHGFTLSTLGNLSDRSFITRFDYSFTILTHLGLEAFAAVRYGRPTGEFRLGLEPTTVGEFSFRQAPALVDLGIALRLEI